MLQAVAAARLARLPGWRRQVMRLRLLLMLEARQNPERKIFELAHERDTEPEAGQLR